MVALCVVLIALSDQPVAGASRRLLEYSPAPVDNPLKGLVPYQGDRRKLFPHSLEFNYLPYSILVKGYDEFDWDPLERMLDDIASRGHQAVLRVYLEYPNKTGAIPEFLLRDGLKVHKYATSNTASPAAAQAETPDYEDKNLRKSLTGFIAALGERYDGDPRIGFITAGLLGAWGEWHTYPRSELFASKTVQLEVMDAYEAAFKITRVLLRYPTGDGDDRLAKNADRKFGYHDDSFAWATLDTGKHEDSWFFMAKLKSRRASRRDQVERRTRSAGRSARRHGARCSTTSPDNKRIQNFRQCVEATHVSWLMDSGMFKQEQKADRIKRAEQEVRRMGYEFHAPAVTIGEVKGGKLTVSLEVENRGVAPFYYDWQPEYGLLANGQAVKTFAGTGKLTGLLPGDKPRLWADMLDVSGVKAGNYTLAVRVPNPMKRRQADTIRQRHPGHRARLALTRRHPDSVRQLEISMNQTTPVLLATALLATGAANPVFVTSDPNGGWSNGGYYVHNNMWNSAKYSPCTSTLHAWSYDNWHVVTRMNNKTGDGAVKTYPNVHRDYGSVPIDSFDSITSTFAETSPRVGIYNCRLRHLDQRHRQAGLHGDHDLDRELQPGARRQIRAGRDLRQPNLQGIQESRQRLHRLRGDDQLHLGDRESPRDHEVGHGQRLALRQVHLEPDLLRRGDRVDGRCRGHVPGYRLLDRRAVKTEGRPHGARKRGDKSGAGQRPSPEHSAENRINPPRHHHLDLAWVDWRLAVFRSIFSLLRWGCDLLHYAFLAAVAAGR